MSTVFEGRDRTTPQVSKRGRQPRTSGKLALSSRRVSTRHTTRLRVASTQVPVAPSVDLARLRARSTGRALSVRALLGGRLIADQHVGVVGGWARQTHHRRPLEGTTVRSRPSYTLSPRSRPKVPSRSSCNSNQTV